MRARAVAAMVRRAGNERANPSRSFVRQLKLDGHGGWLAKLSIPPRQNVKFLPVSSRSGCAPDCVGVAWLQVCDCSNRLWSTPAELANFDPVRIDVHD